MRGFKRCANILKHTGAIHIFWSFLVFLCIAALVLTLIEPDINNFGEGVWYCFVAATTVGFGDVYAVTLIGRIITIVLVLYGIMVTAMVPGVVFTYYMEYIRLREKESVSVLLEKLEDLPNLSKKELTELSQEIKNRKIK